jgi:hypothetical protein
MAIEYWFFPDRKLVFTRLSGHVKKHDVFRYFAAYERDTAIIPGANEIVDMGALDNLDLSFDEMRTVRLRERGYYLASPTLITCTIYAPNDNSYGMARMYQQLVATTQDHKVDLVQTEAEALAGAGQPETDFASLLAGTPLA